VPELSAPADPSGAPNEVTRVRVVVSGHVQAVGYRWSCRAEAAARGVAGWVRNRSDGRVEAAFEGPGTVVDAMVEWCRRGPRGAAVSGVEVERQPPEGPLGFEIRA
jgi:acylphosphatase